MSKKDLTDTGCERAGCKEMTQDSGEPTGSCNRETAEWST